MSEHKSVPEGIVRAARANQHERCELPEGDFDLCEDNVAPISEGTGKQKNFQVRIPLVYVVSDHMTGPASDNCMNRLRHYLHMRGCVFI